MNCSWKIYITLFSFAFIKETKENEPLFIALVALLRRASRAIPSHCSLQKERRERFAVFCQKTSDSHKKPESEFPTMVQYAVTLSAVIVCTTCSLNHSPQWLLSVSILYVPFYTSAACTYDVPLSKMAVCMLYPSLKWLFVCCTPLLNGFLYAVPLSKMAVCMLYPSLKWLFVCCNPL